MKRILLFILFVGFSQNSIAQDYIYETITIRAKPGKLLELIDHIKDDIRNHEEYGIEKPYLMRHSQGDQWDLLLMVPVGENLEPFFSVSSVDMRSKSRTLNQSYGSKYYELVSYQEELFVYGPPLNIFKDRFENFDYYHVEMFIALAGKQAELLKEREMENVYLKEIDRGENLIFTKIMGSEIDIFTLGFYRDIKHFAESADIPLDVEDKAAKVAGFEGVNYIGSYLRSLLLKHNDTLAGAVRLD